MNPLSGAARERYEQKRNQDYQATDKGILYCVTWERYACFWSHAVRNHIAPLEVGFNYLHDEIDAEHARAVFIDMLDPAERYHMHIVHCARVIGYKVLDNQGLLLTV